MNRIIRVLGLLVLVCSAAQGWAADPFIGTVNFHVSSKAGNADVTWLVGVNRIRVESPQLFPKGTSAIVDGANQTIFTLHSGDKSYSEESMAATQLLGTGDGWTLKKTGRTEKIAGFLADEWLIQYSGKTLETLWGTPALGAGSQSLLADWATGVSSTSPMGQSLKQANIFPLRWSASVGALQFEAVSVTPSVVDEAALKVPKAYKNALLAASGKPGKSSAKQPFQVGADARAKMEVALDNLDPMEKAQLEHWLAAAAPKHQ
jgi:hypothetical protein